MSNYQFEERGSFTLTQFEEKLLDAKKILALEFDVDISSIQETRHSQNIGVTVGGFSFAALVVGYQVIKDKKVVAHLEGHLSTTGDYMHVFSSL